MGWRYEVYACVRGGWWGVFRAGGAVCVCVEKAHTQGPAWHVHALAGTGFAAGLLHRLQPQAFRPRLACLRDGDAVGLEEALRPVQALGRQLVVAKGAQQLAAGGTGAGRVRSQLARQPQHSRHARCAHANCSQAPYRSPAAAELLSHVVPATTARRLAADQAGRAAPDQDVGLLRGLPLPHVRRHHRHGALPAVGDDPVLQGDHRVGVLLHGVHPAGTWRVGRWARGAEGGRALADRRGWREQLRKDGASAAASLQGLGSTVDRKSAHRRRDRRGDSPAGAQRLLGPRAACSQAWASAVHGAARQRRRRSGEGTGEPGDPHRRRRLARTEARSDAATSGPRPAPTTISTVTRRSASSCGQGDGGGRAQGLAGTGCC